MASAHKSVSQRLQLDLKHAENLESWKRERIQAIEKRMEHMLTEYDKAVAWTYREILRDEFKENPYPTGEEEMREQS